MRIAAIVPEYPPHGIGGGAVAFEALARAYLDDGHQVRVFAGLDPVRSWFAGPTGDQREGVDVVRYPLLPLGKRRPYLRSVPPPNLHGMLRMRRDLKEWGPDVGHLHGYGHAFVDMAARSLTRARVPYVLTVHGLPRTPSGKSRPTRAAYAWYRKHGPETTIARSASTTAVSAALAQELGPTAGVLVIPNGLAPLPDASATGCEALRQRFHIVRGAPVIVGVGRLARSKGFDVLIEAVGDLKMPGVTCVVAGADAGELPRLEALCLRHAKGSHMLFAGAMDRQGLADLFSIASVVSIPSRDEPFGLVGLEALASGRRVVASAVGGLVDFLRPPVAELVPPEEPGALADALRRAILQGPLSVAESQVAEDILEDHSWCRVGHRYASTLEEAIRRSDQGRRESGRVS